MRPIFKRMTHEDKKANVKRLNKAAKASIKAEKDAGKRYRKISKKIQRLNKSLNK